MLQLLLFFYCRAHTPRGLNYGDDSRRRASDVYLPGATASEGVVRSLSLLLMFLASVEKLHSSRERPESINAAVAIPSSLVLFSSLTKIKLGDFKHQTIEYL